MTETGEAELGLQVVRTLVPDLLTDVPVRVMNVLDYTVTWARGSMVGTLEPVKVVTAPEKETRPAADMLFKTDLMAVVDGEQQPEAKQALSQLIDDYSDVFSKGEYDSGCTALVMHSVDTRDRNPIRQPLRRHPPSHAQAIRDQTAKILRQDLIEPAVSEWT